MCFFSPSPTAGQGKPKPKKAIDLFEDDDEDGDIFSEKFSAPAQSKKEGAEEQVKQPEKKVKINMLVWLNLMSHSAAAQWIKITILPGVIPEAVLKMYRQNVWQNSIISKCCRAAEKDERKTNKFGTEPNSGHHDFNSIFTETANDIPP